MGKESYIDVNQEQFRKFMQLPLDMPVVMINLLKFKKNVKETGVSGKATYDEYMKQAAPFFEKANAEIIYIGKPKIMLIGPENEGLWDKILIVKYNTSSAFYGMVHSEGYPADLRAQSLTDSRLMHCE